MELTRPWTDNIVEYSNAVAKGSLPKGANQKKVTKAGLWTKKAPRRDCGVIFDLKGPCSGNIPELIKMGQRIAFKALSEGDAELCNKILKRIEILRDVGV